VVEQPRHDEGSCRWRFPCKDHRPSSCDDSRLATAQYREAPILPWKMAALKLQRPRTDLQLGYPASGCLPRAGRVAALQRDGRRCVLRRSCSCLRYIEGHRCRSYLSATAAGPGRHASPVRSAAMPRRALPRARRARHSARLLEPAPRRLSLPPRLRPPASSDLRRRRSGVMSEAWRQRPRPPTEGRDGPGPRRAPPQYSTECPPRTR
jgi:hypothetical protein